MKRAAGDFSNQSQSAATHKHQILVQDYLDLQKEFVSANKKLQTRKQKRDILLAEIRFLRQRHKYLLKTKSSRQALGSDVLPPNKDFERRMPWNERNPCPYGAELSNQYPVLVSNSNLIDKEDREAEEKQVLRREEILGKMLKAKKPIQRCLIDEKSKSKTKIPRQDPIP